MTLNWKPRFFTLWAGEAFALLEGALTQFALVWWLTTSTHSATVLATSTLAALLPQIVLGPLAGVIVDRYSRRVIMLAANIVTAAATLALAASFATGSIQVWHVFVVMFFRSASGAFHFPAMQASTSLMVPKENLARVAGMNQTLQGLMSIGAPPLGALLVSALPIYDVLMINIVAALVGIAVLCVVPIPRLARAASATTTTKPSSIWDDLREGVRYVLNWRGLTIIVFMGMVINFLLAPAAALIPILVTKYYHGAAPQMATMDAAWGIGMVAGGVLLGAWGGFKRRIATSLMGLIIIGLAFTVQGMLPSTLFAAAVTGWLVLGLANPLCNGPIFAVLQSSVAPEMQGRVMTLLMATSVLMAPLGLLIAGPVADAVGVQVWYIVGGVACLVIGVAGFFIPALMNIEEQKTQSAAQPMMAEVLTI